MNFRKDFLMHHGIKGQEWGVRNGPPYPLEGHKVSKSDYKLSDKGEKKYVINKGQVTQTLSTDKDRTNKSDMYFASLSERDKNFYKTFFNMPTIKNAYDYDGKLIGPSFCFKYNIRTQANKDINMANEREGAEAFTKLFKSSKDFSNYVLDKSRMVSTIDKRRQHYSGYKEAIDLIDEINNGKSVTSEDCAKLYRLFNYSIPAQGSDTARQRARFFKELKSEGFGAVLDINDAIYGKFKMTDPAIIFDKSATDYIDSKQLTAADTMMSAVLTTIGK